MTSILRNPQGRQLGRWQVPPLDGSGRHLPGREPLYPESEVELDLVAEARTLANEELEQARRQCAQVLAEARAQGYNDGLAAAEREIKEKVAALEELGEAINQRQESFFERMQPEVIELAVAIASKVVGHEVEEHPELVVEQARGCIRRLQEREHIRIRVNPEDVDTMRQAKEELIAAFDGVRRIDVADDRRVGKGGCVVESESGSLDARLDRQLKEVEQVLLEASSGASDS